MRSERRAYLLIVASRSFSEAVAYAVLAAVLHAWTSGTNAIPLVATSVAVFGLTLVLASLLRERGDVRRSTALTALVMGGSIGWAFLQAARPPDVLAVVSRVVGFGILGEVYLWRVLGIARGLQRWRDVRNDGLLALAAVALAALLPGPLDRGALPALGLIVAVAAAVALSLARSMEELSLAGAQIEGRPVASAATGTAFALGLLAIAVALLLPTAQAILVEVGRVVGPVLDRVILAILLPLGYVAAAVVQIALWLRDQFGIRALQRIQIPRPPQSDDDLARALREMEAQRPIVFSGVEIVIGLVALAFAVALVMRLVQEKRALVAEGVSIGREAVEGIGLGDTLSRLLPGRRARPRAPTDDGTSAAAVRRAYWRLLELAEREGPGWRGPAETPAEHQRRLASTGERWQPAAEIVRTFEDLRYGERPPDTGTAARAAAALSRVEAAR